MSKIKKLFESLHKIDEKIVQVGSKWQVQSEDGKKVLGSYDTKEAAEQRLKQIEAFKHMDEGSNAYDYKQYVIIQTPSGWRIKKDDEFIGGEYATDKEAEEYIDSLNETYDDADPRPNESKLWGAVENGELDARHVLDSLLSFLSDDVIGEFIQSEYEDLLESEKEDKKKYVAQKYGRYQWIIIDPNTGYATQKDGKPEFFNSREKLDAALTKYNDSLKEQSLTEMPRLPHLTQKIIDELDKKAKLLAKRKYGADIVDYVSVTSGPAGVEFSAELEYEDMDEIADELNKILEKHGFHTYFEAEDSGFWTAYIDPQFIDENHEGDTTVNESSEIMSTEEFVNWHDKEYMSPEFDFKVEKIYKIFADNNCSEEDDVDVCYSALSDEDKKKVTEIIRKGGH